MLIMKEKKPPKLPKSTPKAKGLKAEDIEIWGQAIQDVTALESANKVSPTEKHRHKPIRPIHLSGRITLETFTAPISHHHASSFQVDRALKKRFESGDLPIDGQIDLHGLTLSEAHHRFIQFMIRMIATKSRFILVITGKGSTESENGRGILRKNLPLWCDDKDLKPHILQMTMAKPKHGGSGASYILLRRQ
jgi:DNA-nicking Smr family endonuclease